jgi:hypothetical protein
MKFITLMKQGVDIKSKHTYDYRDPNRIKGLHTSKINYSVETKTKKGNAKPISRQNLINII